MLLKSLRAHIGADTSNSFGPPALRLGAFASRSLGLRNEELGAFLETHQGTYRVYTKIYKDPLVKIPYWWPKGFKGLELRL